MDSLMKQNEVLLHENVSPCQQVKDTQREGDTLVLKLAVKVRYRGAEEKSPEHAQSSPSPNWHSPERGSPLAWSFPRFLSKSPFKEIFWGGEFFLSR